MVLVFDSNGGRMYVIALILCVALLCTACVSSPDINTPREIVTAHGSLSTAFSIAVRYDGEEQTMELVDNLFRCEISEGTDGTTISLRAELQNISPPTGNYINSVYMRTAALPADGSLYSLSGDPTGTSAHAAKLLVFENGRLLPVVPLQQTGSLNNFLVSVSRVPGQRRLQGWFLCTVVLPSRTAELTGQFTIDY